LPLLLVLGRDGKGERRVLEDLQEDNKTSAGASTWHHMTIQNRLSYLVPSNSVYSSSDHVYVEAQSMRSTNFRGWQTADNGVAIGMDSPPPSDMSITQPLPTSHSKHCTSAASVKLTRRIASPSPGHRLRPSPNGSRGAVTAVTIPASKNLSGLNSPGCIPEIGIPVDRPSVHEDHRAAENVEPTDGAVLHGLMCRNDRCDGA